MVGSSQPIKSLLHGQKMTWDEPIPEHAVSLEGLVRRSSQSLLVVYPKLSCCIQTKSWVLGCIDQSLWGSGILKAYAS